MSNTPVHPEFVSDFPRRHGCAWFVFGGDKVRDPNKAGGWASIGGEDAFRFRNHKELPEGIVWWTNLTKPEAWTLGKWSRFKDNALFGVDWNGWISEQVVLNPDDLPALVSAISETFARIGYSMSQWCQGRENETPWSWGEGSFADALSDKLRWQPKTEPSPQPILAAAYREMVSQVVPYGDLNGRRRLIVSLPKVQHAARLRQAKIPKPGKWRMLDVGSYPGSPDHAARWLSDQASALLVKIGEPMWRPGEEARGAFWMADRGLKFVGAEFEPFWLTGEEALDFARFAQFQLLSVYASDAGWENVQVDEVELPVGHEMLAALANSRQLIASGTWRALASPTRDPQRRSKSFVSERCLWMRAVDRRICFDAAWDLHKAGFRVMGHGDGQAALLLDPKDSPEDWGRALLKTGWCLPMGLARVVPQDETADFNDFVHLDHWIKRVGGATSKRNIDRLVSPWSSASGSVRTVLQKSAKDLLSLDISSTPHWKKQWAEALQQQARKSVDRIKREKGLSG